MIAWMAHNIGWFIIRVLVTLACDWIIFKMINMYGYRVDFSAILFASVCAIITIRLWMPSQDNSRRDSNFQ